MSDSHRIRFANMDGLTQALASAQQGIGNRLEELDSAVASLKSQWTGEAADAYEIAHAQWISSLAEMNALLVQATTVTSTVVAGHRAAQQKVSGIWK